MSPALAAGPASPQNGPQNGPKIWLGNSQSLPVHFAGAGASALAPAQPVSMTQGDFDQDGIADLAVGYRAGGTGFIAIHRGNLDAFAPQSEESFQAIGRGEFPAPFLPEAQTFSVPVSPDFIGAGIFTASGHTDLVVASRGGNAIYLFAGDGKGNFSAAQTINLPGSITTLAAGEMGNGQSLSSLIVGVSGPRQAFLAIYGGTQQGLTPVATFPLTARATSIALGDMDGDARPDFAVLAGGKVLIYYGATSQLQAVSFPFPVSALVLGSFIFDRDSREQLALLSADGVVHIAVHNSFDPRAFSVNEWQAMRQATVNGLPNPIVPVPAREDWKVVENIAATSSFGGGQEPVLLRSRISGNAADDVMVLDGGAGQLAMLSHPNLADGAGTFAPGQLSVRPYSGSPVAALARRVNIDGRLGVVALHSGETAPRVMSPLPDPTFVVDDFTDEVVAGACNPLGPPIPGKCSLREAIIEANATAGVDTIMVPAGTFTLTIADPGTDQHNASAGELSITDGVNIAGAVDGGGNPATIIQACSVLPTPSSVAPFGTCSGTGIVEKPFSVNPAFNKAFDTSFSNLEIRFGLNTGIFGTDGFGGGFDWEASHTGTMTVTNCNIHDNAIHDGRGGGITATNTGGGTGQFTISNSTVSHNRASRPGTNSGTGGGIFFGSATRFTITNTHIDSNQAVNGNSEGGGIFISNPGTVPTSVIHGGTISGNTAILRGGGIRTTAGVTIDQGTVIINNTAQEGGGLWTNLGTSVPFPSGETTTLTKVTIINNTANGTGGLNPGGGGGIKVDNSASGNFFVMNLSRLAGNTSTFGGSNLHTTNPGGALTATNNWWGTNDAASTIGGGAAVNCPTPGAGQICFDPFIVLTHPASPSKIQINQTTTITGDMSKDNHGNGAALTGNLDTVTGLAITWNNALLGSVVAPNGFTLGGGQTPATFNAGGTGGRGDAHVTVDNAVVPVNSNLIASATEAVNTVTITTVGAHGFAAGESVVIAGVGAGGYNGTFTIASTPTATTFTYSDPNSGLGASSGGTADVGIIILQPPAITKTFSPTTVAIGAPSTVTFTVDNSVNVVPINASFVDTLPANLVVATTPNVVNNCGGTVTAPASATHIDFTNAALPVGSCTINVNVQSAVDQNYSNSVQILSSDAGDGNTSTANLTVINPPHIAKAFGAAAIPLNGTTSLTLTIDSNSNQNLTLTGVVFTDSLPAGLVVATPGNPTTNCSGGIVTAADGSSTVALSGASIAPNTSCTVSVNVQGASAGLKINSVLASSTNGGTGNTGNASLTVVAPPGIAKAYNPTQIALNTNSALSFTITNPNTTSALSGVAFTDTLPAGQVVANPNGLTGSCGSGTITATVGSGTISLTGGTLTAAPAAGSTCTFSVNVTGMAAGQQNNTSGAVTSTEGGTGNTASDTLTVVAPPSIAKVFNPTTIPLNGTTTLTFTITNPAANTVAEAGVAFADTLPTGLVVATPNGLTNGCGGTATATAGSTSISLTGGSIAVNTSCTVVVTVTGAASGQYTNTTGVTSTNGGTGNTASANLTVASPPSIQKQFTLHQIPLNGTTTLSFTIQNPNTNVTLTGLAFTDNLPAGLVAAPTPNASNTCGGTFNPVAGAGSMSLAGGTLAASASCTVKIDIQGTTPGVKNNSVQATSIEGGASNTSSDSVTVVAPPALQKSFGAASIALNVASTSMSFQVTNPNTTVALSGIGFTDTLPAGLQLASTTVTGSCGAGTITPVIGPPSSVTLSGGTLAATGSCTFSVTVQGTTAGTKTNTTGNVTSTEGGTGFPASAAVDVLAPPVIAKAFNPGGIPPNGVSTLTITIANPAVNPDPAAGVAFTDNFPANLVVATPNNLTNTCGGTATATAGSGTVSLTGGGIPVNTSCTVNVNVTASFTGSYLNSAGPVSSTNGGTGGSASATLSVANPPTISKLFLPDTVAQNASTLLSFTISNPNSNSTPPSNDVTLTGIAFTDALPAGLQVASPNNLSNDCGGTVTAGPGSTSITLTGGTLAPAVGLAPGRRGASPTRLFAPANGSCFVSVLVTPTALGTFTNITGRISANESGLGATSNTASLTVTPGPTVVAPTLAKAFVPADIAVGQSTALTFTVTNPNANTPLINTTFTDALPSGLVVSSPNGLAGTCVTNNGASITANPGSGSVTLVSLNLPANSSCSFSVNVTGLTFGAKNNVTGAISATFDAGGGTFQTITGGTAAASLNVEAPVMAITKGHTGTLSRGQTGAIYTITVSNTGTGHTVGAVTVVDTLPAVPNTLVPTALSGTGWTCDLPSLTCTRSDALPAGTSYPPITLTVNIPQNIVNHFVNTATVSGGGDPNNHTASDGVTLVGKPILITSTDSGADTVVAGTQATYNFTVDATAINPPPSVLVFTCGGLPKGTACIFSQLATGQAFSQLTLTVTSLGRGNSSAALPFATGKPPIYPALLLSFLALMGVTLAGRRGRRSRLRLAMALMGLMVLMALWGCGGNPLVTPPGTYTITVTATEDPGSGNASGSTTVQLTVQ